MMAKKGVSRVNAVARHVGAPIQEVDIEDIAKRHWPDAKTGRVQGGCSTCHATNDEVDTSAAAEIAKQALSGPRRTALSAQPVAATPAVVPADTVTINAPATINAKIRTADDYIASLRNRNLKVYLGGELIGEPVDHPIIWPTVNSLAETYRLAEQNPDLGSAVSRHSGVRTSRFLHVAESAEDLVKQSHMQRELGRRTGCCFQRCVGMDAVNATWSTTYDMDQKHGTNYHQRFKKFVTMAQENNYVIGGAMTDPKGDRFKAPSQQDDPDLFVHVSGRKNGKVMLRGAKVHQTGTINSHWMIVMPGGNLKETEKDYAIMCAVPVDAPGLTYIYGRQSCDLRAMEGSEIDQGNAQFGASEQVVVFDDVEVPEEMIFMDGEIDFTGTIVERFTAYHRRSYICKAGLADVMLGAAATVSDYNGTAKASHVKDKIVEISYLAENIAGTAMAASYSGKPTASGCYLPDVLMANICKHNVTRFPYEIARITQDLAGGLMATLPSDKDFQHDIAGPLLNKLLVGKSGVTVENRRRILRLIENMTMGRNAIGFMSESMHGAGSPQAQRILIGRLMDVEKKKGYAKKIAGITE